MFVFELLPFFVHSMNIKLIDTPRLQGIIQNEKKTNPLAASLSKIPVIAIISRKCRKNVSLKPLFNIPFHDKFA